MHKKGFTLIELVVVITILSILAVVLVTLLNPVTQFQKTNDTQRKSDLYQVQKALETYYADHGSYPISTGAYTISDSNGAHAWGTNWPSYMDVLPQDPKTASGKTYIYYSLDGQSYKLYTNLERGGNDPQACNVSGTDCPHVPGNPGSNLCGGGSSCNYGLSSPNVSP